MAMRANPLLVENLARYGAGDVSKCYHCGNCTATCHLSHEPFIFPRRAMRALQMGLEGRLRSGLEPWLCYYCGECSEQCPRGADPGETMMSMRRWLTAQYDFTGIAKLFYRSWKSQIVVMLAIALLTGLGFVLNALHTGASLSVYDGAQAFMPESAVHVFDWTMAFVLVVLLTVNCVRMWHFTMRSEHSVSAPILEYLRQVALLPFHFFTQRRYAQCTSKRPWAIHLVLMLSYVSMFALVVFFLGDLQHGPEVRWRVHALGYLAAIGLVTAGTLAFRSRLKHEAPHHKHSYGSDWIFLGTLLFLAVTGIVQHVLHRTGLPMAANFAYLVHLMGVASFEITQVPFGKWSHLAYRPLAIYFAKIQQAAQAATATSIEKSMAPLRAS